MYHATHNKLKGVSDVISHVLIHIGEAYSECLKTDHMVQLIRLEAFGKVKSGGKLEQRLQAMTNQVVMPEMPKTKAVLQSIAASDDHPGAIYRLAGDR